MVKASPALTAFNAGEMSPRMDGRIDFEKYGSAISRGLNLICLPQGGVTLRPGTRFIKETKTSTSASALMPFEPVADQAYMVETGDFYFRFNRNQGQVTALATSTVLGAWTDRSTGSATGAGAGSGAVLTGAGNGYAWAENAAGVSTTYGSQIHVVKFKLSGSAGSLATVQVGSASRLSDLALLRNMGMGWHTVGFNPSGASAVFLQFINENSDTVTVSSLVFLTNEPIEVTSPYPASVMGSLRWSQSGDVKYIFHDSYQTHKLERRGDTSWSLVKVFFQDGPWFGLNPDTDLYKSNLIKNGLFSGGLAEWTPVSSGNGFVNYNTSSTTTSAIYLSCAKDGASTSQISQAVTTGAVNKVHTIHFQVVGGGNITFGVGTAANDGTYAALTGYSAGWYTVSFTPTASPFYVTFNTANAVAAILGGVTGVYCYNTSSRLLQPGGTTGSISVTALADFKPFKSTDVGRSLRFEYPGREPGWGVITAYGSTQSVTVLLYRNIPSSAPLESWRMGAWSDTTGWPHCGTFYQQRLFGARTTSQPQTIWASQSGDFQNMRPDSWVAGAKSVQDSNALNFTLASGIAAPITWLMSARRLIAGTAIGQWYISSKGAALTPSDFSADPQSSVKARDVAPLEIDSGGLFIQRAKRAVYDLGYAYQIDALKASDITILSDHIGKASFAQIVYQAEPISSVWGRLEDGTLACLTYKRDQNVVGWTPVVLAATDAGAAVVESISVIPGNSDPGQVYTSINRDEVWMIVKRTINGVTKRYIEMMEGYFDGPNRATYLDKSEWRTDMKAAQVDAFYVDCGLTYSGTATTTISNLTHLEGETVKVVADGAVQPDQVVTGGAITLSLAASKVQVGLSYGWIYRGMKLPYGSQTGPGLGQTKTVNGLVFVLRDSASFDYAIDLAGDGDEEAGALEFSSVPFRRPGDAMSEAYPLFSGEVLVDPPSGSGFSTDPRVVMQGTAPMPWTLLAIQPRISESEL
ncbi:hypothetical protein [Bradyrhizobium sp. 62]|uniref:hypothetical protein n=1 Tax=Bradyrhizobium sp. 62 TaxID=1043588 RepID=UPI001FFBB305|nr:hypothetical protein [Bradyrhizobium sp. 62]MCK1367620.1 hypothetical protein [Bradyrhizobium sp. 62]